MFFKKQARRALLAAAAFAGMVASSNALTCSDIVTPSLGDGENVAGLVPAGPRLLSTGTGGYAYIIDSTADTLDLYVQSQPGVGTTTHFTRKLDIALSGTGVSSFYSVATDASCKLSFDRFALASPPTGVTISTTETGLTTDVGSGTEATCYFNHKYSIPWENFRGSTSANCGFTISTNTSDPAAGTYRRYAGRVHVMWEDYEDNVLSTPVRPNMTTWYDVTIQVQDTANTTTAATNNTETPYLSNFAVNGITYSKATDGAVTAFISYSLSTNFPYLPTMPSANAYDFLLHTGTGGTATYATLALGETGSAAYPGGTWANSFTRTGLVTSDGSACNAVGEVCVMDGVLTYTWTPTPAVSTSCSISSATAYQFAFVLGCDATYNGTIASVCDVPMRQALDLASFGSFKFQGNVDFCKTAATDFPLTWSTPFDVADTTRTIGQTIEAAGAFTSAKQIAAVAIKEYRVARSDLSGFWSMWTAAADSATSSASAGIITTVGTNTQFTKGVTSADSGKTWSITTSFTPNIKMYSALQTSFDTVASRTDYLISLPNDKNLPLSFTITLLIRLYSDTTQNFAGAKRRLMYRDATVPVIKTARAVSDVELTTSAVGLKVPDNVQVSTDGSVTVIKTQTGPSSAMIGGIAAIGAVVVGAAVGLTVVLMRRKQRNAAAQAQADAEAAVAVHKGADYMDYYMASEKAKTIPAVQYSGRVVA